MNECEVWANLSDQAAAGDTLTPEDRLFLRAHPSRCAACASEASLWGALEKALDEPEALTVPRPHVTPPSPRGRVASIARERYVSSLLAATVLVLVGAAAASGGAWLHAKLAEEPARVLTSWAIPRVAATPQPPAHVTLAAGEASINGHAAVAGQSLLVGAVVSVTVGQACIFVPPGVSVCLDDDTSLSIETLVGDRRRLRLHRGHVVAHLDPQPVGSTFGFDTSSGSVVAKGTLFSLRTDGASVRLQVHEGVVENGHGARTVSYRAPSTAILSQEEAQLTAAAFASDARLVDLVRVFSAHSTAALRLTAAINSAVSLDSRYLGPAPVSALVEPGPHQLEVTRAGFTPIVESLVFAPESVITRHYPPTPAANAGLSSAAQTPRDGAPSAAALLEEARRLRAGGRFREAQQSYERLLREYPQSSEARVAWVSFGELQLSQLGNPGAALRSFDAYLRGGGPLRQEASYGRIRALRQLGRQAEARAAADAFVHSYPDSVQAAALRKDLP